MPYTDEINENDWVQEELLDALSVHDEEWKITNSLKKGGMFYEFEATGIYSCGELVEVSDIEMTNAEAIHPEPEYYEE